MRGQVQKGKNENLQFRYLYGFGILFVVLSHCDGGGIEMLSNWIHFGAFHLAIFVFGSGYFFQREKLEKPLSYLWYKIKTLLIPLWGWNLFYGLVILVLHKCGFTFGESFTFRSLLLFPINSENLYVLNMGSWFIFPFFMVQFIYGLCKALLDLVSKPKVTDRILQAAFVAAGFAGVYFSGHGYHEAGLYPVFRILYFMPFYAFGMIYKDFLEESFKKAPVWISLGSCLLIALLLNTRYGRTVYAIPASCDYPFGVLATYLSGVIGILFWLKVSQILEQSFSPCKPLAVLGRSTWEIMIHQFAGIMAVKSFFAGCNRLLGIFSDFDMTAFLGDIWYLYRPKGIQEYTFLYVLGALGIPLLIGGLKSKTRIGKEKE